MTADPIDPGALPIAAVVFTNRQLHALLETVAGHTGAVRAEKLSDGYVRVVLIGPEGEPVRERLLFPR